ncbi:MAG: GAF domain-containing protein, partial [Deltaproteobacteria bacterium]|nr:GAF domain-containing protein [Deltaproteobacteria bacterium]
MSFGLLTSSAVLVHFSGGYPEIHFHFLVMVALMALYQDWAPYLLAILFVAVHQGIFGILLRGAVYDRPEVLDAPWTWAGIHAFAILCTATASVVAWRFNEKASDQLKLILNSVGEGLIGLDRDGKVTFVNPAASDLLGWDPQKIVGSPLAPALGHRRNDGTVFTEITSPIFTSLRDGTRQSGSDHLFSKSDGTDVPVDFLCTPAVEGSYITGGVVSFRDVTARQKAEERLRQTKELQTLHDINRTILESRDIYLMMGGILDKVFAIGGYDIGMICLASSDRKSLEPVAHRGFRDSERWDRNSARRELWPRDGIVDRVLTTRQIRSVDLSKGDRIRTFREEGTQQLVIVPLRTDREGLGVFYLGTRSAREFRANEIDLLDAIGLQVGIAIQKATLFEQAAKKSRELETLARINRNLASRLNDETLLPRIVEEAKKTLQADGAYVRLIEADSLVLVSGSTPESHYTRERIGLNESLSGKIVRENRVLAISNILADPTLIEDHRQLCLRIGYQSFLGIPLRVGDQVIGAVSCLSKRKREFRPDEIELMTSFADQAAIAIHNARLYGQSEQSKKELESANRRLEKLLEDQSSLYADLTPLAQAESIPQLL